jgi:hypothetical protein
MKSLTEQFLELYQQIKPFDPQEEPTHKFEHLDVAPKPPGIFRGSELQEELKQRILRNYSAGSAEVRNNGLT